MDSSYELKQKRKQFISLRDNLNRVVNELQSCLTSLQNAQNNFGAGFTIDGIQADNQLIERNRRDILQIVNDLKNTILPNIDNRLYKLNKEIKMLEAQEVL